MLKLLRLILLGLLTALTLFGILIILSFKYIDIKKDYLIYIYTIGVAIFELSIITGSFFYYHDRKWKGNGYEPKISFIIPAHNEENNIYKTIGRCFEVEYSKDKIEVIVVNDGSTDNTWREIQKAKENLDLGNKLIAINWEKNRGKKYAMAEAFKMAKGEIIVQLDSDSYIEKKSLRALVEPFKESDIGAVTAHTDPENKYENLLTRIQAAYYFISFRASKASESLFGTVFCCSGCCSAFRKEIILSILDEWLSEKFLSVPTPWDDDRSLTNFILISGYKTIYLCNVQAYTIVPNNLKQFIKQQIRWKKCWFVSSIKTCKFIFKKDKFVAMAYFYPLVLITLLTPIVVFKALVIDPLLFGIYPTFYIIGVFLITTLSTIHYIFFREDENWKYMFLWTIIEMTILPYVMIYALADIKNPKWGTR